MAEETGGAAEYQRCLPGDYVKDCRVLTVASQTGTQCPQLSDSHQVCIDRDEGVPP